MPRPSSALRAKTAYTGGGYEFYKYGADSNEGSTDFGVMFHFSIVLSVSKCYNKCVIGLSITREEYIIMKCPICGKDVELKKKQIGTDENGEPVFNEYAICRDCKKQWNLDKQRAKKMAAKKAAAEQKEEPVKKAPKKVSEADSAEGGAAPKKRAPEDGPVRKRPAGTAPRKRPAGEAAANRPADGTVRRKPRPADGAPKSVTEDGEAPVKRPVKKRVVRKAAPAEGEEQQYGNIPPEKVRVKREKAARKGYEDMLATDPDHRPLKKKKAPIDDTELEENESVKPEVPDYSEEEQTSPKTSDPEVNEYDDEDDYDYEDEARFRPGRIFLGILSLLGFGFFIYRGFVAGLSSSGDNTSAGMTYVILAVCLLVSALLYLIMQNKATLFAFLLPMIVYIGTGVFAFLRRGDSLELLAAAIACAVLAVISLILAIASRGGSDDDDDYDDPFEEEHDN